MWDVQAEERDVQSNLPVLCNRFLIESKVESRKANIGAHLRMNFLIAKPLLKASIEVYTFCFPQPLNFTFIFLG